MTETIAKRQRERRPHLTKEKAYQAREEYRTNPLATIEYLADKYGIERSTMSNILSNKTHHDPMYERPERKSGGRKRAIYLPEHIQEAKDLLTPPPTTAHRARGQNRTINRFK